MKHSTGPGGLVMDMEQGEVISLGHNIRIHFLLKSGRVMRVCVSAPPEVKIRREHGQGKECRDVAKHGIL